MNNHDEKLFPILDSSLILTTFKKLYNIKIVDCGNYSQVYFYENKILKTNKDTFDLDLKKININKMFNDSNKKVNDIISKRNSTKIEEKNIIRSKLECQRLAKANIDDWKTFITLTFAKNIIDIKLANKRFRYFIDKVQRIKKDLKYICIPEFQKRGATHYHLLTNIDIFDKKLIYLQEDNNKFFHIKYWNDGFTSVEILTGDVKKIIGYIAKYMTKDIDNRLFNCHRYFFSRNLNRPVVSYIDLDNIKDLEFYKKITQEKDLIFREGYLNKYDNTNVLFLEYLKK